MIPADTFNNHGLLYLQKLSRRIIVIYCFLLVMVISIILSLPFLYIDISIVAPGIVRPSMERTAIKSIVPGYIDTIFYRDGEFTQKDNVIISFKSDEQFERQKLIAAQLLHIEQVMYDLRLLTKLKRYTSSTKSLLTTAVCKEQLSSFLLKSQQHEIGTKKILGEVKINKFLLEEKVISKKELADKEYQLANLQADYRNFIVAQQLAWQEQLSRTAIEQTQLKASQRITYINQRALQLKAPVAGVIQLVNSNYQGSFVQAGETLCTISPETTLIAECVLTGKNIAMVREHQKVSFRLDAFNYSYFGMLTGSILSIDNDYSLMDNRPVFKIKCSFDNETIGLKNGFTGRVKKGLTLQANIILTRRSVWQLLFDKLNDWLNPATHTAVS